VKAVYTWGAILAIVFASVVGDVLLARAMKQVGDVGALWRRVGLVAVIARTLGNPYFLCGVTAMAVAFFALRALLGRRKPGRPRRRFSHLHRECRGRENLSA
jgi:hypothetical protein